MKLFTSKQLGLRSLEQTVRATRRRNYPQNEVKIQCSKTSEERYEFTLKECCLRQEIWTIFDEAGLYAQKNSTGEFYVPVFPAECFAAVWISSDKHTIFKLVPIPIDDYIDQVLPVLHADRCSVAVFPTPQNENCIDLPADEFLFDLVGFWEHLYGVELGANEDVQTPFVQWGMKILKSRQRRGIASTPAPKLP